MNLSTADGRFWNLLSATERTAFERSGIVRRFAAGAVIVHEGDPSQHVLVVLSGCVKVAAAVSGGGEFVLGLRGPGDIVGELASIDHHPRRGTVSAIGPVEGLVVPGDRFARLAAEHRGVSAAVERMLAQRLGEADRYRLAAASAGVAPRLASLVLDLAARYGTDLPGSGRTIGVPLAQHDLASLLATSPRTVARILKSWRRAGVIRTGRRSIVILRAEELRRIVGPR
jgi:CRP/FNR family transcriptional regulator, cyclic AMP receptor protein